MNFVFKVIILFMIVFNWRMPYVYNSVFLAIIFTTIYYIFLKGSISFKYFFQRYNAIILIATLLLGFIIFAIPIIHGTDAISGLFKRIWVMISMLAAIIFALPLFVEGEEENSFTKVSIIICYAFALQGLIHLLGFLFPPIGDFLFDMKPDGIKALINNPANRIERFRAYALTGSIFFELPAAYGVACILFFRLLLNNNQNYISGWRSYIVLFFLITGISLSGRTGFVGLSIGFALWFLFNYQRFFNYIFQNIGKLVLVAVTLVLIFNFILSPKQRKAFTDDLFPFAFEAFYNWSEGGPFGTKSLDVSVSEQFYYDLRDETLFVGHGLERGGLSQAGYSSTDAGYMRSILFGGIPFLICLIVYQSIYFFRPLQIANNKGTIEDKKDLWCILLLFGYMFLLHIKENAMGTCHIVETLYLVTCSSYIITYYAKADQEEPITE